MPSRSSTSRRRLTRVATLARDFAAHTPEAPSSSFAPYAEDPVRFAVEVLGIKLWSKQVEIARAIAEHNRVTVVSGNGVGKSEAAAAIGLWYYATRSAPCRVIITSPTARQIHEVIWSAVRRLYRAARQPLQGEPAKLPSTGLRDGAGRELFGITAEELEGFQGIRAPNMLVIVDEASGVADGVYQAIHGNLSGDGKLLLIGNGMISSGYFFESHKSELYRRLHISVLDSPNVLAGRTLVPGLATRAFVEECRHMWGEDSALYKIRVLGQFVEDQEGRLFPPSMIERAENLLTTTRPTGRVVLGIDPAGEGSDGDRDRDASAFAARRGKAVVHLAARSGMSPDAHVVEAVGILEAHRGDSYETPLVVLDRDGPVGARVYGAFLSYLAQTKGRFELIGIRGSEKAKRRPFEIDLVRDEMWFGLVEAFREGLAIPKHMKLEGDLSAIRFDKMIGGRAKVVSKTLIRRELGRSPDLGDALALCAYEPVDHSAMIEAQLRASDLREPADAHDAAALYDQQSGNDIWWPSG